MTSPSSSPDLKPSSVSTAPSAGADPPSSAAAGSCPSQSNSVSSTLPTNLVGEDAFLTGLKHSQRFLSHLSSHLSNPASLDTTLLTISYTLRLLSSSLPSRPTSPAINRLQSSLPPLSGLLDDYRIKLRLFALIPILSSALKLLTNPPRDVIERTFASLQATSLLVFQAAENAAVLAGEGVLKWRTETINKAWIWSSRAWALWVGLELARLGWERRQKEVSREEKQQEWQQKQENSSTIATNGDVESDRRETVSQRKPDSDLASWSEGLAERAASFRKEQELEREEARIWTRDVGINLAYLPMTWHYSRAKPLLADRTLAALGVVVAWLSFGDSWTRSGRS